MDWQDKGRYYISILQLKDIDKFLICHLYEKTLLYPNRRNVHKWFSKTEHGCAVVLIIERSAHA